MADNFGLKIGLEGEKEFKKALADINQSFKVLGSEMKVVQSQFDKNDDSVEALTARNQVLGKEIDAQKKKIETLRKALENASTSFGENDRRTQQWQIQLNNAQAALNNMERELDQNQRAIDSMGDEMRDAAQQTDKFGDEIDDAADKTDKASGKLEKVSSVLKGLAVTAGAAVAAAGAALAGLTKSFLDLAESTREYREDQAKLDSAFTTAGFTAEQAGEAYTGFYAILGEEDRSVEAVNHLAKLCSTEEELAQWTDIAAGVWATFGDSLPIEGLTEAANETAKTGTITGQLADALNWAGVNEEAFQSALDGCSSEQERAALITDTLNGLYQEAAENYKTLNGDVMEAQRAQALLTDAYAQLGAIAEPIMTTLKTMAADVLTAMIPFVSLMGEGLQGVLNGTAGAAETFAEGISGLVSVLMEKLSTIVPVIGEAILASLPVLLEAGVNIIATLVTGIVNALPQLAAAALSIVLQLVTSLTELAPQLLQAAMQVVATLASGIASALPQLVPTIVQMVVQICQTLIANLPLILDAALQLVTGLAQGILNALPVLIAALPEIINGIVTFLLNSIPQIIETGIQLLTSLVAALPDIITAISDETLLTPATVNRILVESGRCGDFLNNPEAFLEQAVELIRSHRHALAIDGIRYVKLDGQEYYVQEIFDTTELLANLDRNAVKVEHSVYDYVVYDSSTVEKPVAVALDNDPDVKMFFKIPSRFKIETPIGTYNPDWAVYLNKNGEEKLYFVLETKGDTSFMHLKTSEQLKIHCGKEHFKALDAGVELETATSWTELRKRI